MARVLALANPSGRSGKTSAALGLSTMLVDLGRQVLAVDLDAHGGLTNALGVDAEALELSVFDVLIGGEPVLHAMTDTDAGVDLLPGALELSGVEASLVTRAGREQLLLHALAPVADDYDWIVIDCASAMGLLTINALSMADVLIVPAREFSARGLGHLLDAANEIRALVNPGLHVTGILPIGVSLIGEAGIPVLSAIPEPPRDLNAYRELAKTL